MPERVLVDYGPHFKPDGQSWELHLQRGPGHPRYRFESSWADEAGAREGAVALQKTFRDDTTYVAVDVNRRVVAVKFMTA